MFSKETHGNHRQHERHYQSRPLTPVAEALSVPMRAIVQPTFLLEPREGADAIEVSLAAVAQGTSAICTYSSNASAKRAAQRMISSAT